jgi:ribosome-binding factor A
MARAYQRSQRVGDQIQRELAQLILQDVKDPRVGMVTITGVEVTKEFEHATVYVTVLGDDADVKKTLEGLNQARGFLRRELARRVKLRIAPDLHFTHDKTVSNAMRLSALIDSVAPGRRDDDVADPDAHD